MQWIIIIYKVSYMVLTSRYHCQLN